MANKYSPFPGDIVDAKLEPGEYVLNRNAVNAIGEDKLNKLNNEIAPRFQEGGMNFGPFKSEKAYRSNKRMQKKKAKNDRQIARLRAMRLKQLDKARGPSPELRRKSPEQFNPQSVKQGDAGEAPSIGEITNYARMKADSVHRDKMNSSIQSPSTIRNATTTPIDLQKVEVPMGHQFNSDEFNNMLGTAKVMNDYMINQGMTDSQGRSPFNVDYGQIKGLDPKTFKMPTDRMLTPAEQLMAQMNQPRNQKMNTYIDEDNPAIEQIYKDNPLMEAERLNRRDNLQKWSDDRTQNIKDEVALEYSPQALYNHDTDGIGGSKADAMKRQADRELAQEQSRDIAMMNPGKQPDYFVRDRKTNKSKKTDRKGWLAYQAEGGKLHKKRMEDEMMSKDGKIRLGSKNKKLKEEAKFRNQKKVAVPGIKKGNRDDLGKLDKLRLYGKDRADKWSKAKAMRGKDYDKYLQRGGMIGPDGKRRYALGALVSALGASGAAGASTGASGLMSLLGKGKEGLGLLTDTVKNRYGGKQFNDSMQKQKSMGLQRELNQGVFDDRDMGDMSVADDLTESNIDMAKMMRDDFGMGDQYADKEIARNEAIMGGASQFGEDVKAIPGLTGKAALGAGAVALGAGIEGAKGAYKLGKSAYEGGKTLLKEGFNKDNEGGLLADASAYLNKGASDDYGDVWSGKAKGSLMQRGRKGLGGLGMLLQDASQAQGFQGADWKGSGIGMYSNKDANDEAKKQTGIDNETKPGDGMTLNTVNPTDVATTSELLGDTPVEDLQLENSGAREILEAAGVQLNKEGTTIPEASTSGGNTNIMNDPNAKISDESEMPDWMKKMADPNYVAPVPSGIAAPDYDPNAPAPEFNLNDALNPLKSQHGGPVSLEGFIQQSWRNMR